jgi:hypothetical protein
LHGAGWWRLGRKGQARSDRVNTWPGFLTGSKSGQMTKRPNTQARRNPELGGTKCPRAECHRGLLPTSDIGIRISLGIWSFVIRHSSMDARLNGYEKCRLVIGRGSGRILQAF